MAVNDARAPHPAPSPSGKPRVGLREVAAAADVCVMTVSLALRDNPRISAATRARVKRIAEQLGYRPDPELSRLMNHLRVARTTRGHVGVAVIDFYPTADFPENFYNRDIRAGASRRARQLGFSLTPFHLADYHHDLRNLLKVVRARGIEGAFLMPSLVPLELQADVNWDGLSVVTTSKSILAPRFHCVVPNQFGNTMRLLDALRAAGQQRVCAVFDEMFDERTGHNFTAAMNWHGHGPLTFVVPQGLAAKEKVERVIAWIVQHRPDVVFAQSDVVLQALPRLRRLRLQPQFHLVGLGEHNSAGSSHLDECAEFVGRAAVDVLAGMMYYHETGIPEHPRTTLIDGKLVLKHGARAATPAVAGTAGVRSAAAG